MAPVIAHNLPAMNANRQLKLIERSRVKATKELSSGYRINCAADDASGLAISEKMRSQIRGLNQAYRNIQDGISYVQVADGALGEVHTIFQRIRELSVQAANGTNTPSDRYMIDLELDELKEDTERIFEETEFNTLKIWSGEPRIVETIVGSTPVPAVTISYTSVSSTITNTNRLIMPKGSFRLSADADGIRASWTAYDGNTYTSELIEWEEPLAGTHSFHLKDYLNNVTYKDESGTVCMADARDFEGLDFAYTYTVAETATLNDAIKTLNQDYIYTNISTPETGKIFTTDGISLGGQVFSASTSVDISYDALLVSDRDFEAPDTVYIEGINKNANGDYANVTNNPVTKSKPSEAFEFEFRLKTGQDASGNDTFVTVKTKPTGTSYYCSTREKDDEGIWWHSYMSNGQRYEVTDSYSSTPACSPDAITGAYAATHTNTTKTETLGQANQTHSVYLTYYFSLVAPDGFTCKDGTTATNVGSMSITLSVPQGATAAQINAALGKAMGLDIDAPYYNNGSRLTATKYRMDSADKVNIPTYEPRYEYKKRLDIQAGANEQQIIPIEYDMLSLSLLNIEDIRVDTFAASQDTLKRIDRAIKTISEQRSLFGAYQNRLEHAAAIDGNTAENLQAAESLIRDADMASSTVDYSKSQILSQAAQPMLTRATQSAEAVLGLLQS